MVDNAMQNDALHVVTANGEINPVGRYDASWHIWVKGYEPKPSQPDDPQDPDPPPSPDHNHPKPDPQINKSFSTGSMVGRAAYEAVKRFMDNNHHQWDALVSCQIAGTSPTLADQIASIAQGDDQGIAIALRAQNDKITLAIQSGPPSEYKEYATSARRMLTRAGIDNADVSIRLDATAAQRVLERLNNRDDANIAVTFQ